MLTVNVSASAKNVRRTAKYSPDPYSGIAAPARISSACPRGGYRVHPSEVDVALRPLVDGPPSAESLDHRG
jgi:hypothetical protein